MFINTHIENDITSTLTTSKTSKTAQNHLELFLLLMRATLRPHDVLDILRKYTKNDRSWRHNNYICNICNIYGTDYLLKESVYIACLFYPFRFLYMDSYCKIKTILEYILDKQSSWNCFEDESELLQLLNKNRKGHVF